MGGVGSEARFRAYPAAKAVVQAGDEIMSQSSRVLIGCLGIVVVGAVCGCPIPASRTTVAIDESLRIMCANAPDDLIESELALVTDFSEEGGTRSDAANGFIGFCALSEEITSVGARVSCAGCRAAIIDRVYGL